MKTIVLFLTCLALGFLARVAAPPVEHNASAFVHRVFPVDPGPCSVPYLPCDTSAVSVPGATCGYGEAPKCLRCIGPYCAKLCRGAVVCADNEKTLQCHAYGSGCRPALDDDAPDWQPVTF